MRKKRNKNPLIKRILRELSGDWKKYLVVALFLILTIGFVSGMYVANGSMLKAAEDRKTKYKLEDGHFELQKKADAELLAAIGTGEKADVKQYYLDKATKELDEKFEKEFAEKFDAQMAEKMSPEMLEAAKQTDAYQTAYDEAYREAYEKALGEINDKIDDEYAEAEEKYELNDPDFQAVKTKVYENFYRNEEEDYNNDGETDGTIRVYATKRMQSTRHAFWTESFRSRQMKLPSTVCMRIMSA